MKKAVCLVCLLALLAGLCSCGKNSAQLEAIRSEGVLRVGVKADVVGFGYMNPSTKELEGLEIDIAKMIAKELLGDAEAVRLVPVTALTREPMLENGELDLVIATFTITPERQERFLFSQPYYTDEIGFMVKDESDLFSIADLDGKTIGIANSGTARAALEAEAAARGIQMNYQTFSSYPEIKAALLDGTVDAFSVDKSILMGYSDESTRKLEEGFSPQDYGIATGKNKADLAQFVDNLLGAMSKDGRLDEILARWGHETK